MITTMNKQPSMRKFAIPELIPIHANVNEFSMPPALARHMPLSPWQGAKERQASSRWRVGCVLLAMRRSPKRTTFQRGCPAALLPSSSLQFEMGSVGGHPRARMGGVTVRALSAAQLLTWISRTLLLARACGGRGGGGVHNRPHDDTGMLQTKPPGDRYPRSVL